ncbi:hypothetical protein Tco_1471518 [Tanacetum coccineum]
MHYLNITMRNVVKVFYKDSVPGNDNGVGGSKMLMEEETIVKLIEEEEMADLELHVSEGGEALGENKASTHPVIDILLYPLGAVEAACVLEVDAMGALDLVEVEAVGSSSLEPSSSLDI